MAHWVKGRIAEKNKDISAAEKEYRAAIDASKGGARAWLNLAGFYRHMNRLDDMEKEHIIRILKETKGNKKKAAEILGIERRTLYNKAKRLGIDFGSL